MSRAQQEENASKIASGKYPDLDDYSDLPNLAQKVQYLRQKLTELKVLTGRLIPAGLKQRKEELDSYIFCGLR